MNFGKKFVALTRHKLGYVIFYPAPNLTSNSFPLLCFAFIFERLVISWKPHEVTKWRVRPAGESIRFVKWTGGQHTVSQSAGVSGTGRVMMRRTWELELNPNPSSIRSWLKALWGSHISDRRGLISLVPLPRFLISFLPTYILFSWAL